MPRFFFDLFFDHYVILDPGGMVFECVTNATAAADEMARHLLVWRTDLRNSGSRIRVRDERRNEVCRLSIDPDATSGSTSSRLHHPNGRIPKEPEFATGLESRCATVLDARHPDSKDDAPYPPTVRPGAIHTAPWSWMNLRKEGL